MAEAAAVVGLVASVGSLIDLGIRVTTRLHDFTTSTSDVPETFRSLEKRLPLLIATLKLVQQQADAGGVPNDVSVALRSLTQSTFRQLKVVETCLQRITPAPDASRIRRAMMAFRSLTKDADIQVAVDRVHKDIDFLVFHQTTHHVDASDRILAALTQLKLEQAQAPSFSLHPGCAIGPVTANDHANVHLGDVYNVHQPSEPGPIEAFGLCLTSAPLIEPDNFVGRVHELEDMVDILRPGQPAIEQRRVILGGLGGMGKTQLAIAYARQHHASYTSVFWLNATSELTLTASLRSLAETRLAPSPKKLDDAEACIAVFGWLSDVRNTQWLLIFDNHDDPDQFKITDYMPNTCNGTIIITTRMPDGLQGQRMQQIRVSELKNVNDSVHILQSRSQRRDIEQDPDAHQLAKRLAGLPLALATAGAYLRKTNLTCRQFLDEYEKRFNASPRRPVQLEEYTDRTLYTTWDLTYRRLDRDDPRAANLLRLLAYFDNQEIWFELLHAGLKDGLPDWVRDVAREYVDFENVMGTLVDYCLIEVQQATRSYSMHNCVHDWTLAQLNQTLSKQLWWYAVECITASIDKDDWESLGQLRYARLTRHALRCTKEQFQRLTNADVIPLDHLRQLLWIAELLAQQVQYAAGERTYERALAGCEAALGPDHTSTLDTVHNLGNLYKSQGKLDKAEQMYKRALAGCEAALGPDHTSTLDTVHNLGLLYSDQGKLDKAEQMYERALAGYEKALGTNHTSTLDSKHRLANLYRDQGKLDEAESMYRLLLPSYEKASGDDHPSTMMLAHDLGFLYERRDRLEDAKQLYKRALTGYSNRLGENHTRTRSVADSFARLCRRQGEEESRPSTRWHHNT